MKKPWITAVITYGCSTILAGILAWVIYANQDFMGADLQGRYRILCDAFMVPGIILVLFGALVWAFSVWTSGKKNDDKTKEKKLPFKKYAFLFIVGGLFILVSVVFLILFYRVMV